ncbi:S8 family peptidase [Phytomonospora sp. NPDC050363]|uniref:S8 family peptidase n=1 Tax=Phytomonospora sp. NPDC050363 TaxID=3155642 RepID=UPI0033DD9CDC
MSSKTLFGRKPVYLTLVTVAVTAGALLSSGTAAVAEEGAPTQYSAGRFIVELDAEPVATYDGGVSGLASTRADEGERLDTGESKVARYRNYLAGLRGDAIAEVPGAEVLRTYDTVFNGFTAELTAEEALALSKAPGVKNLYPDEQLKADTVTTPDFLGLTGASGVWEQQYGGDEHAGEGVIVGILDSGVWPENPSFGALPEPRPDQDVIDAKWNGTCQNGETGDPARDIECNNKVIGARYYKPAVVVPGDFASPRDHNGHGSHVGSTAAGNHGVDAGVFGKPLGKISGMAPAARLAFYKICWTTADGGCTVSSANAVAAIEDAVNDGVDVINYSISGSTNVAFTPQQLAYFNAAAAGVFVANSAGNSGPGASTVAHNTPWVTTVAASTHGRISEATVTLGNGQTFKGASLSNGLPSAPVVLSGESGLPGGGDANLCAIGSLDPAKVTGKIVACARGTVGRVDKGKAVLQAGGVGMILYNPSPASDDVVLDAHVLPAVHVNAAAGSTLLAYLSSTSTPTAAIGSAVASTKPAPEIAGFSSAGPALAAGGDLLKPDITAPGVDVYAAVAPPNNNGQNFGPNSGTSMSSPHIAGLAALVIGKHPDWSPMAVKSALMTTASQTDTAGRPIQRAGRDATAFDYGAGHVTVGKAFDPGLVYDSDAVDWLRWGCGVGELVPRYPDLCAEFGALDPTQLNYPSIAIGNFVRAETVTRTVTNVSDKTSTYFATTDAPEGTKLTVSPQSLTLRPGQSASFKVTVTRTTAALGAYTEGSYTWRDLRGHSVRSPVVVKPGALAAPKAVEGTGTSGSVNLAGTSGYTGTLNATVSGLAPVVTSSLDLRNPDGSNFPTGAPAENDHVKKVETTVPAGATASFNTYDSDYAEQTDLDLFFYRKNANGSLTYLGASAGTTAQEGATLPGGATYVVYVDLFASPANLPVTGKLHVLALGGDAGNFVLNKPSQPVNADQPYTLTGTWSGLTAGLEYRGVVTYRDATGTVLSTTTVVIRA